jgi:hypothetical protein
VSAKDFPTPVWDVAVKGTFVSPSPSVAGCTILPRAPRSPARARGALRPEPEKVVVESRAVRPLQMEFWVTQLFNGVSYGALLFLLGGGLTLIFGMMRIVNRTHGSHYLFGCCVAVTVLTRPGSYLSPCWWRLPSSPAWA